ncbi:hypothetical protein CKF54_07175 [Psittacicella hinzii]|uniref:Uncharacterized protein n=1 Tax=Psittacicella hinzii TaxID=2028575 RepID=A0A3A1Y1X9_9GAMM|nr:hypothetical protein [Psittacicella hinzii]RIY31228.1 hypothetical protein CKF54_07175 [Psittacicella hinzii]
MEVQKPKKRKKLVASILLLIVLIVALALYLNRQIFTDIQNNLSQRQDRLKVQKVIVEEIVANNQLYIPLAVGEKETYCYLISKLEDKSTLQALLEAANNTEKNQCGVVYFLPLAKTYSETKAIEYILTLKEDERRLAAYKRWLNDQYIPTADKLGHFQQYIDLVNNLDLGQEFPIFIKYQRNNQASTWYSGQRALNEFLQFR